MPELTLEKAKSIVDKGIEFGAWSWSDPDNVTDDLIASTADMLVNASRQATEKNNVNDAVLEILHVAGVEPVSEVSRQAYARRFGTQPSAPASQDAAPAQGAFAQPTPADITTEPQPPTQSEPAHSPAPEAGVDIESIFPGYDDMKVKQIAEAVLISAKDGSLSPEEWESIKTYEASEQGGQRKTILSLQPEFKAPEPSAPEPVGAFGQPTAPSATGTFAQAEPQTENVGEGLGAFYNGETISRAQQEGLPIPPQTSGEGVVMPIDITGVTDQELSRLATSYHSLFARAQWLISQEEGRERAAEQLEHDAHRDAYIKAYENHKSAIPEGKSGPTALDAARKLAEKDADNAKPVHDWRTRKIRHGADTRELKALSAGYDKAVWRINEELERRARLSLSTGAAR